MGLQRTYWHLPQTIRSRTTDAHDFVESGRARDNDRNRVNPRAAFTLFEVALSLVLVTIGVISLLLLMPIGIRAQQLARAGVFATAKAMELMDDFCTFRTDNAQGVPISLAPWDVPLTYRSMAPDLEARLSTIRYGMFPLPTDIAQRLESDNDEIADILSKGGYIYYAQPRGPYNVKESEFELSGNQPNEIRRLVFAVNGYAQQNAVTVCTPKPWPVFASYPTCPVYTGWDTRNSVIESPTATGDPDISLVYDCDPGHLATNPDPEGRPWGFLQYVHEQGTYGGGGGSMPWFADAASCKRYAAMAFWYASRKYDAEPDPHGRYCVSRRPLPLKFLLGTATDQDVDDLMQPVNEPFIAGHVRALSYLAHAAMAMTRLWSKEQIADETSARAAKAWQVNALGKSTGQTEDNPAVLPQLTIATDIFGNAPRGISDYQGQDVLAVTHARVMAWHELSMKLIMQYAARFPYDWGCARPLNRVTMMDFPLLQLDLFSDPDSGLISGSDGDRHPVNGRQWKMLTGQPVRNRGEAWPGTLYAHDYEHDPQRGGIDLDACWGNQDHANLAARFDPSERCRQLVFWNVDWQAYEDCETAPSAPVDASRYPMGLVFANTPFSDRTVSYSTFDDSLVPSYRNPEKNYLFKQDVRMLPTGADVKDLVLGAEYYRDIRWKTYFDQGCKNDQVSDPQGGAVVTYHPKPTFSGLYGADRNGNNILDRGPLPVSTRMRAITVVRFNFYDPRVPLTVR